MRKGSDGLLNACHSPVRARDVDAQRPGLIFWGAPATGAGAADGLESGVLTTLGFRVWQGCGGRGGVMHRRHGISRTWHFSCMTLTTTIPPTVPLGPLGGSVGSPG